MASVPPSFSANNLIPQPAAMPMPNGGFGAGVAPGFVEGASALYAAGRQKKETERKIALIDKDRQQAAEASTVGVNIARAQESLDAGVQQLQDTGSPDGAGHVEAVDKLANDTFGGILDNASPEVRNHFAPIVAELHQREIQQAQVFAHGRRAKYGVDNLDQTGNILAAQQSAAAVPGDDLKSQFALLDTMGAALGLDPNLTAAAVREKKGAVADAFIRRWNEVDPERGQRIIESGVYNDVLGDRVKVLRADNLAEEHKREVDARQAVSERRQDANTFLDNIGKMVDNHIPVPPESFEQARRLLADPDLKLDGKMFDVGKWAATDKVVRAYQNATPQTIGGQIDHINAEIARKGDKVDPALVIERNVLQSMLPQRREEQRQDPLALYARSGGEVTPLNPADPASIAARRNQWQLAQGRLGPDTGPLLRDEASAYEQHLAQGNAAGRVEVVNTLAGFGPDMGVAAARQIAPGNQHLQTAVALAAMGSDGRAAARDSLLGSDALAAHRGLIRESAAHQAFGQLAEAMTGLSPDAQHGIYDTAAGIFATRRVRNGRVGEWPEFADDDQRASFKMAVQVALGAQQRPNGELAGGIGNHAGHLTLLPTGVTQSEFDRAFARSSPEDFARAAGGARPVYANGKFPTWGEFKNLQLEAVGDGRYRVKLGRAYLGRSDGRGLYEFDARLLARIPH
jgi:hypothetical protein